VVITVKNIRSWNNAGGGVVIDGVTVDVDGMQVEDQRKAVEMINSPDSSFKNAKVVGRGQDGSVGFKVTNSPRPKFGDSESHGFATGFDVDNSPDPDFGSAKAFRHATQRAETPLPQEPRRTIHVVKLPEGMQKKK
jgi:hypothetical protein